MCVRYNLTNSVFLAYVPHLIAAIGVDFRKPYSQCQEGYIFLFVKKEKSWELDLGFKRIGCIFPALWVSPKVAHFICPLFNLQ